MDVDESLNVLLDLQCPDNAIGVCCSDVYDLYASREKIAGSVLSKQINIISYPMRSNIYLSFFCKAPFIPVINVTIIVSFISIIIIWN